MEEKIINIANLFFKILFKRWIQNDDTMNHIEDLQELAKQCGLSVWEAKKFNRSIDSFMDTIAEGFIKEYGIHFNDSQQEMIYNQISMDISSANISNKK